jgi:protein-S-isoprenylcysteine O-methyltransferase Ste14
MKTLDFFGAGPKIGKYVFPWFASTIIVSIIFKGLFRFVPPENNGLLIAGIILMAAGLAFYFSTVRLLLRGLKQRRLVTNGSYSLCQNPLYSSIILFIIPALSFLMNSWLVLSTSILGYIVFKNCISKEYNDLEEIFGEEYLRYKKHTPEFFPFPYKKWFGKKEI